jgi:hypothetical protein
LQLSRCTNKMQVVALAGQVGGNFTHAPKAIGAIGPRCAAMPVG